MRIVYDCDIAYVSPRFDKVEALGLEDITRAIKEQMRKAAATGDPFAYVGDTMK